MSEERFDYEVDDATRFVDNLKDKVHDLYDENHKLKEEIERLNKEIETLKQPQIFIDTQDIEERYAQEIYEDFIEEKYEKLIFDYLTNNCKEFDDEHIKKLVDLKVEQHLSSQKEVARLNNVIEKIKNYVYKPIDKEWDDILCIIEDSLKGRDKE